MERLEKSPSSAQQLICLDASREIAMAPRRQKIDATKAAPQDKVARTKPRTRAVRD